MKCESCNSKEWAYTIWVREKERFVCNSCFEMMYQEDPRVWLLVESKLFLKSQY